MEPIQIYSDVICPWCFVGKIRLDKALARLKAEGKPVPEIFWHPYELNPDTPEEGEDRLGHLESKYGAERVAMIDERLNAIAEAEGFRFNWAGASRIPNTFKAHRLIGFAQAKGLGHAVAGALFNAYFLEGRDVGDEAVLVKLGAETGLDKDELERFFESNQGVGELRDDETQATQAGLRGVPYYLINRHPMYGAQEVETFLRALQAHSV
jgi:predicted DsbA family dithiol-disulfide isomerase